MGLQGPLRHSLLKGCSDCCCDCWSVGQVLFVRLLELLLVQLLELLLTLDALLYSHGPECLIK
jgi:hypothetical protein